MGSTHELMSNTEILRDEINIEKRLARLEALAEVHLEKGGTLEKLETNVERNKTRILFISGGITALFNALRFVLPLFTKQ